jgi:hypothetical protein
LAGELLSAVDRGGLPEALQVQILDALVAADELHLTDLAAARRADALSNRGTR